MSSENTSNLSDARHSAQGDAARHATSPDGRLRRLLSSVGRALRRLVDGGVSDSEASLRDPDRLDWTRVVPFALLHVACVAVLWVGVSWVAVAAAVLFYVARMFVITGFYHRYFSHRCFKTSRVFQFLAGFAGCTAGQRGPLWWAAHHRHHHNHSDDEPDLHSPRRLGFLWSHTGWFLTRGTAATDAAKVRDWLRFKELALLDRFDWVPFLLLGGAMYALGAWLEAAFPSLGTSGPQMLVWGFVISTILLYHGTYTINSLAHRFGKRRFKTGDDSRNSFLLALLTLGEGWHNNHHHYPVSARQGFYWWELDLTYYGLRALAWFGLIRDIRPVPKQALARNRVTPVEGRDSSPRAAEAAR